jgi:hypothetical protein
MLLRCPDEKLAPETSRFLNEVCILRMGGLVWIASSKIEREDLKESFVKWLMDVRNCSATLDIVWLTTTPTLMRPTNRAGTRSVAAIDWSEWQGKRTEVSSSKQGFE